MSTFPQLQPCKIHVLLCAEMLLWQRMGQVLFKWILKLDSRNKAYVKDVLNITL